MLDPFLPNQPGQEQGQLDVLQRGQHGDQVVELEDETDVARSPGRELGLGQSRDDLVVYGDGSGRGSVETGDQVQERRLSRPGGPHQGDEIPLLQNELDVLQDRDLLGLPPIRLGDVLDADHGLAPRIRPRRCARRRPGTLRVGRRRCATGCRDSSMGLIDASTGLEPEASPLRRARRPAAIMRAP